MVPFSDQEFGRCHICDEVRHVSFFPGVTSPEGSICENCVYVEEAAEAEHQRRERMFWLGFAPAVRHPVAWSDLSEAGRNRARAWVLS